MMMNEGFAKAAATTAAPVKKKKWGDMSVAEKVVELYMGEKGVLFFGSTSLLTLPSLSLLEDRFCSGFFLIAIDDISTSLD
ncbi:hypothetical protein PanWU01x14_267190 [Parasponia andersonii]|uniref:Uncharacterized protein n=1 Tax=Parasponia andersonii TaxID=3476 RepID=A0A2P5B6M2_PARAD|nr:hypothetical protein PanWU01x14_267190 [Parasponia andersonii]